MDTKQRDANVTTKRERTIDGFVSAIQRLGEPSSYHEWYTLRECMPFYQVDFRTRDTEANYWPSTP